MNDIVYILKEGPDTESLRYSLRSVEKNWKPGRVWFVGGKPEGLTPDGSIYHTQEGNTKWERVCSSLLRICQREEISEDFWLFNDDFFIMKNQRHGRFLPMTNGTIWAHIKNIEDQRGGASLYTQALRRAGRELKAAGFDRLNYALHVPMLINREKGLETLLRFPHVPMFRSLYGNQHQVGGILTADCKIVDPEEKPAKGAVFLSTNDTAFNEGAAGEYIRAMFQTPSRFEAQQE